MYKQSVLVMLQPHVVSVYPKKDTEHGFACFEHEFEVFLLGKSSMLWEVQYNGAEDYVGGIWGHFVKKQGFNSFAQYPATPCTICTVRLQLPQGTDDLGSQQNWKFDLLSSDASRK